LLVSQVSLDFLETEVHKVSLEQLALLDLKEDQAHQEPPAYLVLVDRKVLQV